jgi:hypothetical protein
MLTIQLEEDRTIVNWLASGPATSLMSPFQLPIDSLTSFARGVRDTTFPVTRLQGTEPSDAAS